MPASPATRPLLAHKLLRRISLLVLIPAVAAIAALLGSFHMLRLHESLAARELPALTRFSDLTLALDSLVAASHRLLAASDVLAMTSASERARATLGTFSQEVAHTVTLLPHAADADRLQEAPAAFAELITRAEALLVAEHRARDQARRTIAELQAGFRQLALGFETAAVMPQDSPSDYETLLVLRDYAAMTRKVLTRLLTLSQAQDVAESRALSEATMSFAAELDTLMTAPVAAAPEALVSETRRLVAALHRSAPFAQYGEALELAAAVVDLEQTVVNTHAHTTEALVDLGARLEQNVAAAAAHAARLSTWVNWLSFALLALGLMAFWWFVRRYLHRSVIAPLTDVTAALTRLAAGQIQAPIPRGGTREFAAIEQALNVFRDTLRAVDNSTRQVALANQNLLQSNRELERFAYAASHDLRSPLRAVSSLVGFLAEDLADASPQCRGHISKIKGRIARMETLLDDLLTYAQVQKTPQPPQPIRVRAWLEELVQLVGGEEIIKLQVYTELPTLYAERAPLSQVLQNLLDNAVKYAGGGIVHVSITRDHDRYQFSVADQGPGIALSEQARIFDVFERLHAQKQVPGSGLGLAMVQKLVKQRGGAIAVISNPKLEPGTRFTFDWPAAQAPAARHGAPRRAVL